MKEAEDMRTLFRQLTRSADNKNYLHVKQGAFNFIVVMSKILFSTMDSKATTYYTVKHF
jgi:hypothetical protein